MDLGPSVVWSVGFQQLELGPVTCERAGQMVWRVSQFVIDRNRPNVLRLPSGTGRSAFVEYLGGFRSERSSYTFRTERPLDEVPGFRDLAVGIAPQHFEQMVSEINVDEEILTVLENKRVPQVDAEHIRDRILREFELQALRYSNPRTLSGGEVQRLALALAAVSSPDLLILDDPFSELDAARTHAMLQLLMSRADSCSTCLIVSANIPPLLSGVSHVIEPEPGVARASKGPLESDGSSTLPIERDFVPLRRALTSGSVRSIALDRVLLRYPGQRQPALKDLTTSFDAGEIVHVSGPNGAGKSSLFAVLQGFERISQGHILINGTPARMRDLRRCRRYMSALNQTYRQCFFQDTAAQELEAAVGLGIARRTLAWPSHRSERVPDIRVMLHDLALEHCAQSVVDELSVDDRRMLGLACAVCSADGLLFLDEPTAGVGRDVAKRMAEILRASQSEARLVLLVSHDRQFCDTVATRRVHLQEGVLIEDRRLPL